MTVSSLDDRSYEAGTESSYQIVERRCCKGDTYCSEVIGDESQKEGYYRTEDEESRCKESSRILIGYEFQPLIKWQIGFLDGSIVLHEEDHADTCKDKSRAADNGYDEHSESLITDTCNDSTYCNTEEISRILYIVDSPVIELIITELTCIYPIITK